MNTTTVTVAIVIVVILLIIAAIAGMAFMGGAVAGFGGNEVTKK